MRPSPWIYMFPMVHKAKDALNACKGIKAYGAWSGTVCDACIKKSRNGKHVIMYRVDLDQPVHQIYDNEDEG